MLKLLDNSGVVIKWSYVFDITEKDLVFRRKFTKPNNVHIYFKTTLELIFKSLLLPRVAEFIYIEGDNCWNYKFYL